MVQLTGKLIENCILIGLITLVIGYITEKILYAKDKQDNFLTKLKRNNVKFFITLFLFGIMVHLLSALSGFEAYCEKKCNDGVCNYSCHVGFNPA